MLQLFRSFFKSKVGIIVTLAFLGLIAVAFASSDVANNSTFGGVAGGDRVAVVGDRTISTSELAQNANNALEQARQNNPTLSMPAFIEQGGLADVIEQLISRSAIAEFGELLGLRAGRTLVNSEITNEPSFRGAGGEFDPELFRNMLRQRGLSEAIVRDDLALSLMARQTVVPLSYQTRMPESFARTYAQLLNETRIGTAVRFPAEAFAPAEGPSDAQLQEYYAANQAAYIRPERRTIRYATFDDSALGELPAVTDEQIAARYEADAVLYRATERRSFTQLVVPTQAAAQAVIDEVNGGMSLNASATSKGLATTTVSDVEQPDFATTASEAVAEAAFDAPANGLVGPVRGSLGWYVLRVTNVEEVPARSLAQASDEIRETLTQERRREAMNELTERFENEFARGKTLAQAAEELGVEIETTPPLLANGQVYGQPATPPEELARVVNFAFQINEQEPQITEIVAGTVYMIFDVGQITRSAAAPLAEIRNEVTAAWRREQGMAGAAAAARRVLDRVEGGASLAAAVAEEDASIDAPTTLRLNRQELAASGQVNRATILFFSMAEGTTERVSVNETSSWFVVQLNEIETAELSDEEGQQFIANTAAQLSAAMGEEYVEQFVEAAQRAIEIERNEDGINAVRDLLTGNTTAP
ncbi:peptidylprolyl isomerase [Aurantiacibacter sp. D1-12]|uniref:peptidylprolyl isomerase n=1 Tax=Aurantiacibacter sp. D1-12 TaxID=2993658 RepID=UPI00237C7599|nr:peptidylprolyl isomerase [Aurantiacibacter sp. D1-12]MDE1466651.1 SurA N-terminal domain-containing protein [Aurantiacibacter sp. D1-12]